jgi:hypothetical protein
MSFEDVLNRHNDHKMVILPRYHKGKTWPVPGLYCESCAKLIKWLNWPTANDLIEYGVEQLDMTPEDERALAQEIIRQKSKAPKIIKAGDLLG